MFKEAVKRIISEGYINNKSLILYPRNLNKDIKTWQVEEGIRSLITKVGAQNYQKTGY